MKKISLLCVLALVSCGERTINFSINNQAGVTYDSAVVSGLGRGSIANLEDQNKYILKIDYSKSRAKFDGGYVIKLFLKDSVRVHNFGYHSSGIPSSKNFKILIKRDTFVIFEEP